MTDAIDLSTAILPAAVQSWPATTAITSLTTSANGLDIAFSKRDSPDWPDIIPTGWAGPVYYTVWLGAALSDGVHFAPSLNVFRGQPAGSGAGDVTNIGQYSQNLWYLDPELKAHVVTDGETLYLMVTAGGLRGISAPTVHERSNVVAFKASSVPKVFTFSDVPTPVDPPVPPTPPVPDQVLGAILTKLNDLEVAVLQLIGKPQPVPPPPAPPPIYDGSVRLALFGTSTFTMTPRKS